MYVELISTESGEHSLYLPSMDETYHNRHGAISEGIHVFLEEGLSKLRSKDIQIFEMGFGTGLNALLTCLYALQHEIEINYHALEAYPLEEKIYSQLNYPQFLAQQGVDKIFKDLHSATWETEVVIAQGFSVKKIKNTLDKVELKSQCYDLVYYDAFAPSKQAELWTEQAFRKMYDCLKPNGLLCTYSAAGQVKRSLKAVGFQLKHPPGANGKREMTVACKS